MRDATLSGKPYVGDPHVGFDEGEDASAKPRRGALLYRRLVVVGFVAVGIVCLTADSFAGSGTMDITAALRAAGAANYSVEIGPSEKLGADGLTGLADGDYTTDSGRLLLLVNGKGASARSSLDTYYTATPEGKPTVNYLVSAFTVCRIHTQSWNWKTRTAHDFSLEGSVDGVSWRVLYRTPERLDWSVDSQKTFSIPLENRFPCRHYRFRMHPLSPADSSVEDTWSIGIQELALYGEEISDLIWNGQAGDVWSATAETWLGRFGGTSPWISGAEAFFDRDALSEVTVDGQQTVEALRFNSTNRFVLSGSALAMPWQANILAGYGDVVNVALHSGTESRAHTGWLPAAACNRTDGMPVLLWERRRLSELTAFSANLRQNSAATPAEGYRIVRDPDGRWADVQFQRNADSGSPPPLLCIKVRFEQIGEDIWGRILYARYSRVEGRAFGDDFDVVVDKIGSVAVYDGTSGSYGLKDIVATGDGWTAESVEPSVCVTFPATFETKAAVAPSTWLLQAEDNPKTGRPVVYWKNRRVSDLAEITSGVFSYSGNEKATSVHYFTNDGTTATVQFQANSGNPGARLCVKVEFTQQGDNVLARAVYVKYDWGDTGPHDFDPVVNDGSKNVVYDGKSWSAAYSVRDICGTFRGGDLTLNGALDKDTDLLTAGEGRLTLGMESVDLCHVSVSSGTTLRLASASEQQTAIVSADCMFDRMIFGGRTTLSLTDGAALLIGAISLEAAGEVTVDGNLEGNVLRIGTTKCLTTSERAKIRFRGRRVAQDENGYLRPAPGLNLWLR